jgi:hypothetical protein
MIENYVTSLADQMGVKLSKVYFVEGKAAGCLDSHTLMMSSKGCNVSTIIYQTDLEHLKQGNECNLLEASIREKLSRLQILMDL